MSRRDWGFGKTHGALGKGNGKLRDKMVRRQKKKKTCVLEPDRACPDHVWFCFKAGRRPAEEVVLGGAETVLWPDVDACQTEEPEFVRELHAEGLKMG